MRRMIRERDNADNTLSLNLYDENSLSQTWRPDPTRMVGQMPQPCGGRWNRLCSLIWLR